jgi:hypothetical protein
VHVTAHVNSSTAKVQLQLKIPSAGYVRAHVVPLYDDGMHGDKAPGDGEWATDYRWNITDAAGNVQYLYVVMDFTEGNYATQYGTLNLNVEPERALQGTR